MKSRLSQILKCVPVAAAVLGPSTAAAAAIDYFLKIDGIEGESNDAKHKGEIQVRSFSFAVANATAPVGGGGGGAGRPQFSDLSMAAYLSKASPQLYLHCAVGKHIKSVQLVARKAGGKEQQDYYLVTLTDVVVSSVQTSGEADSGNVPMDAVSFNYSKIEWSYRPQKPDGSLDAAVKTFYDLKQAKGG